MRTTIVHATPTARPELENLAGDLRGQLLLANPMTAEGQRLVQFLKRTEDRADLSRACDERAMRRELRL